MEPALKTTPAPKQNEIQNEIDKLQIEELLLRQLKDKVGLGNEQVDRLKTVAEEVKIKQKALKRLISNRKSQQKLCEKRQSNFKKLIAENPQLANQLAEFTPTSTTGKPPLEKEQPGLLKAIIDAVSSEATDDERRRSEVLRSCKTLHSVLEALKIQGNILHNSMIIIL
ncbi:unnamed protein product [Allacma fusca]|uniref:Uncharacterized protein n=1 Tax=Allacma fusca TaxID=39272 RepID=A0A8J2PNX2_9HEXA|nr:unnamed protein product [Allacma fusca]